jgi:hypothetical protein
MLIVGLYPHPFGVISVSLCDHSLQKQNRGRLDLSGVNTSKASQELSSNNEHIYVHTCVPLPFFYRFSITFF